MAEKSLSITTEPTIYSELINSLREQLKLQHAINYQYEVDLEARDELVTMLQTRLKHYEEAIVQHYTELRDRRISMKSMGRTVEGLETLCRQLEGELQRSREESRVSESLGSENASNRIDHDALNAMAEQRIEDLTQLLKIKEAEADLLTQERHYALENTSHLEGLLRQRDADLKEARTRVIQSEQEVEELRSQLSSTTRERTEAMEEQTRRYNELEQRKVVTQSQLELAIKEKAEKDATMRTLQEQATYFKVEAERLQKQVHGLKQESADKEVKIAHLDKLYQQVQEDKAGLNIALVAKQQELDLMKRKLQVKGTGGSTPVHFSTSESSSRRGSLNFTTPLLRRSHSVLGVSHSNRIKGTPETKSQSVEDTSDLTTIKANKIGLPVNGPPHPSIHLHHQAIPGVRSPTRQYLKTVNGPPAVSRRSHHPRSSSVLSTPSVVTSDSEKENSRANSRVSVSSTDIS